MDHEGSGDGIDAGDLKQALQRHGIRVTIVQAAQLIKEIDDDGNGSINFEEFFEAVQAHFERQYNKELTNDLIAEKESATMAAARAGLASARHAIHAVCPGLLPAYLALARRCKWLVEIPWFDRTITFCIMLVAVATVLSLEVDSPTPALRGFLLAVQAGTLSVFTLEVVLKVIACGPRPLDYINDPEDGSFNMFDCAVVLVSLGMLGQDGEVVAVCRLLRLIKIMNKVPQLRVVLLGLVAGMRAVSSIMLLMLLIMFLFSITGIVLFGKNDPGHFDKVETGMLTLFQVATLASWNQVFHINFYGCEREHAGLYTFVERDGPYTPSYIHTGYGKFHAFECAYPRAKPVSSVIFFFIYTVITSYVVLSLFISVITSAMFEVIEMKKRERKAEEALTQLSPAQKRERMIDALQHETSELRCHLDAMFGKSDYHPHDKKKATQFGRLSIKCEAIANTNWFATTILLTIVAVGVVEICDTNEVGHPGAKMVCQYVFLAVFLAEAVVKLIGFGWNYWKDGWNRFDFVIVAISVFELIMMFAPGDGIGGLTFLRLLRLLRVMRMLNSLPALRSVTQSLILAFANVGWVMLMMLLINFVFAVMACLFFARNDPQHFKRLSSSVMSIWMVETFDAWEELLYINMYGCSNWGYVDLYGHRIQRYECNKEDGGLGWLAAIFFVFVCVIGGLIMPTVLIGVISVAFEESTFRIKEEKKERRCEAKVIATARQWGEEYVDEVALFHMQCVFDLINFEPSDDGMQTLEADELLPFLEFVSAKYLSPIEEKKLRVMFDIVDASGDNEVSWVEFMWFVLFLKKARSRAARAPLPTEPVSWYVRPHGSLIPRRERTSKTGSSRTLPSALFLI